jgi:hypothetical protein
MRRWLRRWRDADLRRAWLRGFLNGFLISLGVRVPRQDSEE